MSDITTKQVISFILKTLHPFLFPIMIVLMAALVWAIDISFSPYLIKVIIDRALTSATDGLFHNIATPAISYVLILFLLECIAGYTTIFLKLR